MNSKKAIIRILSIVPYQVFPAVMGGQKGIALFYRYLSQLLPLTVLTIQNNTSHENYKVISTLSNARWRYMNPLLFFTLRRLSKEQSITHLLFEHPYYAWLISIFRNFSSKQIIVHSHNIESERFRSIGKWWWKLLWHYEKWAYGNAHFVWFKTTDDMEYAISQYRLNSERCSVIPYGVELTELPSGSELKKSRETLQKLYNIQERETIILFNGTLSYKPNLDALLSILDEINPLLLQREISYKILICGKNLPATYNELSDYSSKNIIYCGFVDDIDLYFKGCDIFLNPLQDGGGIKTKLVEALGFGKICISSANGAIGVLPQQTQGRLHIVSDTDWKAYSDKICLLSGPMTNDNSDFYRAFSWKQICKQPYQF
ncbi:MAG: glycosyltransferase family 4 protein [Bacteroidetes bacterium]|nr:glycosyltransferase family 4 protein [Bacteroidota bacterium]